MSSRKELRRRTSQMKRRQTIMALLGKKKHRTSRTQQHFPYQLSRTQKTSRKTENVRMVFLKLGK